MLEKDLQVLAEVLKRNGYTVTKVDEGVSPRPLKTLSKKRELINQFKREL